MLFFDICKYFLKFLQNLWNFVPILLHFCDKTDKNVWKSGNVEIIVRPLCATKKGAFPLLILLLLVFLYMVET